MTADTANAGALARATRAILKGAGAQLAGKKRGRDIGEGRRVPRRNSYEVSDPRARPWKRIGDGSYRQGVVHREALMQAARELRHQDWKELPARQVREARALHAANSAELDELLARDVAPTGRPATLRRELERLGKILERARLSLRRSDLAVLEALLQHLDFRTGQLDPTIDTIAAAGALHRNSVNGALARLRAHGLIDWVRRTVRTDAQGEFAPQLEQTSNAYFFDHRARMQPRVWHRYWQILVSKLRRLGRRPATAPSPAEPKIKAPSPGLEAVLAGLEAAMANRPELPNANT